MTRPNDMSRSNKMDLIIAAGAINAFIAVAAGAFAAHGLKNILSSDYLAVFRTAADYQMMHGLGLILIGVLNNQNANRHNMRTALFMLSGIILFSGSLYLLATTGIKWLGMITPFGGVCFLIAWLTLAINYLKNRGIEQ
jgi:uncharacterized membrane protein YgdD (TMEM256/DUF423 family)